MPQATLSSSLGTTTERAETSLSAHKKARNCSVVLSCSAHSEVLRSIAVLGEISSDDFQSPGGDSDNRDRRAPIGRMTRNSELEPQRVGGPEVHLEEVRWRFSPKPVSGQLPSCRPSRSSHRGATIWVLRSARCGRVGHLRSAYPHQTTARWLENV